MVILDNCFRFAHTHDLHGASSLPLCRSSAMNHPGAQPQSCRSPTRAPLRTELMPTQLGVNSLLDSKFMLRSEASNTLHKFTSLGIALHRMPWVQATRIAAGILDTDAELGLGRFHSLSRRRAIRPSLSQQSSSFWRRPAALAASSRCSRSYWTRPSAVSIFTGSQPRVLRS